MTAPKRVDRMIGLLALAFLGARLVGKQHTHREGPPRRKSHGRCQRSRFRYGIDRFRAMARSTPESFPPLCPIDECPSVMEWHPLVCI